MLASVLRSVVIVALTTCLLVATAGASKAPVPPLRVHSASFSQDGLKLVWRVRTDGPFSPNELNRDRLSLCLLLERVGTRTAVGELCVKHPGSRRHPQLIYRHLTRTGVGHGHLIAATVTRANDEELTASFLPGSVGVGYRTLRWQVLSTDYVNACAPAKPTLLGCGTRFPVAAALARLHTPKPVGCTANGPPFVYGGPSNRRVIALTFDDGPWYDTPQFLDILEREHVVATFFEIGDQIATYGQGGAIERRMLADGDMIGDHTWNHQDVAGAGSFAAGEISQAAAAIRQATGGFEPCLFRAPYGDVSSALISEARSMGFTTIQWDIDPRDWARPGTEAIYQNVVSNARPGGIVEEHDGGGDRSETIAALPQEIGTLRSEGYRFVTVTQLLGDQIIYR